LVAWVKVNSHAFVLLLEQRLKYHTQILVKRKGKKHGRKISGIMPVQGEDKVWLLAC
jgi:hypothetical protein